MTPERIASRLKAADQTRADALLLAAEKVKAYTVNTWTAVAMKLGVPAAAMAFLLYWMTNVLAAQLTTIHTQNQALQTLLAEHQAAMDANNRVQAQFSYQICVSVAVVAGRNAAVCPQPPK